MSIAIALLLRSLEIFIPSRYSSSCLRYVMVCRSWEHGNGVGRDLDVSIKGKYDAQTKLSFIDICHL